MNQDQDKQDVHSSLMATYRRLVADGLHVQIAEGAPCLYSFVSVIQPCILANRRVRSQAGAPSAGAVCEPICRGSAASEPYYRHAATQPQALI